MAEGEEADDSSKTEEPTPRKLEESRKKGQIALSKELNNWIMLLTGTIVIAVLAGPVFTNLSIHMKTYIEMPHLFPRPPGGVAEILGEMFFVVLAILSLPLILLFFMAFLGPFIQVLERLVVAYAYALLRPFTALLRHLTASLRPLTALLRPLRALVRPLRALVRPLRALLP
jgi:flagellar biosynthesis protein FlhB